MGDGEEEGLTTDCTDYTDFWVGYGAAHALDAVVAKCWGTGLREYPVYNVSRCKTHPKKSVFICEICG